MEETKFNEIMKEIRSNNLTSTQLENLFMALKEQPLALGGKFFTMDDAYEAILDEAPNKDVVMEALNCFNTENPAMYIEKDYDQIIQIIDRKVDAIINYNQKADRDTQACYKF